MKTIRQGFNRELNFRKFDSAKVMDVEMEDCGILAEMSITPNQANEIITYLAEELKKINEPVEILNK